MNIGIGIGIHLPRYITAIPPVITNPYIIQDSFNRANSDALTVTDTGQAWELFPPKCMGVRDNAVHAKVGRVRPGNYALAFDPNLTVDQTVELTIRKYEVPLKAGALQLMFRGADTNTFYRFGADTGYGGHFRIVRRVGNSDTVLGTDNNASMGVPKDGDRLKVVCSGIVIRCYVNDILFFTILHNIESHGPILVNATKAGIALSDVTVDPTVDDFKAWNTFSDYKMLSFNGTSSYVDMGKAVLPAFTDFTVITRFKTPSVVPDTMEVWSEDIHASLKRMYLVYRNGKWIFSYYRNDGSSGEGVIIESDPISLRPNTVYTTALRRTGNTITLFVNGVVIIPNTTVSLMSRLDGAAHRLFRRRDTITPGLLISHSIYTRALTATEMIYYTPTDAMQTPNILSHYDTRFKGDNTQLVDQIGYSPGAIYNGEWVPIESEETGILISDNFNRADHPTDIGDGWESLRGAWGRIDGQAYRSGQGGANGGLQLSCARDVGAPDFVYTSTITETSPEGRILFRILDANNMYQLKIVGNSYVLRRVENGVISALGGYNVVPKDGDVISIRTSGRNISIFLNGLLILTQESSLFSTATKCGFGSYANITTERYDDFRVEVN